MTLNIYLRVIESEFRKSILSLKVFEAFSQAFVSLGHFYLSFGNLDHLHNFICNSICIIPFGSLSHFYHSVRSSSLFT